MKRIKILQYTGAMNRGGAETLLMNIYRNIDRSKFEFHFITHSKEKSDYDEEIIKLGGKIIYLDKPNLSNLNKFYREFKNIVTKNGPYNAIHTHVQLFNGIVLKAAKNSKINVRISHAHLNGDYNKKNVLRKIYVEFSRYLINKYSTDKISCSYESGLYLYKSRKFTLLNNAIDIEQFRSNNKINILKKELNLDENCKIITHIGTFKKAKNHEFIINVFKLINDLNKNYKLVLVGRGELEEKIKSMVRDLSLENKVFFLGIREDINDILQSSNVFFMPSILEGLPVALVEAQAAGVRCVISDNIPKDCDMGLGLINRLSLSNNISEWVDEITNLSSVNIAFDERKSKIVASGYDLKNNIDFLVNLYSSNN